MGNWDNLKQGLRTGRQRLRCLGGWYYSPEMEAREDIASRITVAILSKRRLTDVEAVTAMRCFMESRKPDSKPAIDLHSELLQIEQLGQLTNREFRQAVREMLEEAGRHQTKQDPFAFIRYLSLLAQ